MKKLFELILVSGEGTRVWFEGNIYSLQSKIDDNKWLHASEKRLIRTDAIIGIEDTGETEEDYI